MDTTVAQLRAANGLRGDLINIGQKLQVPGAGNVASASAAQVIATNASSAQATPQRIASTTQEHKVRPGETLWRIARSYRTSVEALRMQNDLANDLLRVGQVLRVVTDES
jgi:LysM repeat protein